MKKTILFIALALSAVMCSALNINEFNYTKTKISYNKLNSTNQPNFFTVKIKDTYKGEFEKDPIAFIKTHFKIKDFITEGVRNNFNYQVIFKSRKGQLNAEFDKEGNLLNSSLKFENIIVPYQLQRQLYRDHKGWAMVKNLHVLSENRGKVIQDYYKVTLKKGNKKMNIRIHTSDIEKPKLVAKN